MGSAIDLFVTYRFLKLLTTDFKKTDAYKLGIIDDKGHRIMKTGVDKLKPKVEVVTTQQKNAYTILHKLVFNIKKLFKESQWKLWFLTMTCWCLELFWQSRLL